MRIHARRIELGDAVVHALHDLLCQLFRAVCDDLKAVRDLKALQHKVADLARDQQGDEREQHGIELRGERLALMIDEEGREHDAGVKCRRHGADAQIAELLVDEGGKHRRAAARAAASKHDRKRKPQQHAARNGRENGVVFGRIADLIHSRNVIKDDKKPRCQEHGKRGDDCLRFSEQKKRHKKQRHVERNEIIARIDVRDRLQQDGNAVDPAGRKFVGCDKDVDRQRADDARGKDRQSRAQQHSPEVTAFLRLFLHNSPTVTYLQWYHTTYAIKFQDVL